MRSTLWQTLLLAVALLAPITVFSQQRASALGFTNQAGTARAQAASQADREEEESLLNKLHPPRPPLPPSFWEEHRRLIFLSGGLVILGAFAAAWWLCRSIPQPITPPSVHAEHEIEAISREPDFGVLLSRLSHALRQYLVQAFDLPAREMTTREFTALLRDNARIGRPLAEELAAFLQACDERKFSHEPPAGPTEPVNTALKLIEASENRLAEWRQTPEPKAS